MTNLVSRLSVLALLVSCTSLVLPGCGEKPAPTPAVTAATPGLPATPPPQPFLKYAADPAVAVTHTGDAPLFEHFCRNASGAACAPETYKLFESKGFAEGGPAKDLANAATLVRAAADGAAGEIPNTAYVVAAYRVVLGREPDELGKTNNIAALAAGKTRSDVILGMLQSEEFKRLSM